MRDGEVLPESVRRYGEIITMQRFLEAALEEEADLEAKNKLDGLRLSTDGLKSAFLRVAIDLAIATYLRDWQSDWFIPPGFMECRDCAGKHFLRLARLVEVEAHADRLTRSLLSPYEPETADGEEVIWEIGSRIPIILMGFRPAPPPR